MISEGVNVKFPMTPEESSILILQLANELKALRVVTAKLLIQKGICSKEEVLKEMARASQVELEMLEQQNPEIAAKIDTRSIDGLNLD